MEVIPMPELFEIKSSVRTYTVNIGKGMLQEIVDYSNCDLCLVDANLEHLVNKHNGMSVISVVANEENKSLERLPELFARMRQSSATRSSRLLAVGGGVIQDIATLLASLYMRGIDWEYVPSTLLGMVDSCIGGKSSINIGTLKNIIGNIYPPDQINIDVSLLETLSRQQIIDGLCEAVKICFAGTRSDFEKYLEISSCSGAVDGSLQDIIGLCLSVKKRFIEIDEFDQNERLLLNYGHTFGHALESALDFRVSHGIAVGLGMCVACELSKKQSLLNDEGIQRCEKLITYVDGIISEVDWLADLISRVDLEIVAGSFENDKKHRPDCYRVIVPVKDGSLVVHELPRNKQSVKVVTNAFADAMENLKGKKCR